MNYKVIIACIVSAGAGFAGGWFLKKHLDDKEFDALDDAYREYYEAFNKKLKQTSNEAKSVSEALAEYKGVEINSDRGEIPQPQKIILTEEEYKATHPTDSDEDNSTGDRGEPYDISVEQYEDESQNWEKTEYTYYRNTTEPKLNPYGILIDELADAVIMDAKYDTGYALSELKALFADQPDGSIIYVRNPYLICDIAVKVSDEELDPEYYDTIQHNDEGRVDD